MCHYITAVMSADGDETAVREAAKASGLSWKPLENRFVSRQLRDGERLYLTTKGSCNCGTHFGVDAMPTREGGIDYAAEKAESIRQKGLKKGWTAVKIDRAIEQERLGQERRRALSPDQSDLGRLRNFFTQVLSNRHASYLGLFLHYYEGTLESEEIMLSKRRWIPLNEFDEAAMRKTPEDSPLFVGAG